MSLILTGTLATSILRIGAVTDDRLDAGTCTRILEESFPSKPALPFVRSSLGEGAARRALANHGIFLVGDGRSSEPDRQTPVLDVVLRRARSVESREGLRLHYLSGGLAAESLLRVRPELGLGDETYATAPALTWLLASMRATDVASLKAAMELCGTYATAEDGQTSYGLPAATTPKDLVRDLGELARGMVEARERSLRVRGDAEANARRRAKIHGLARTQRMAPLVLGGSASPLETDVAIMLTMPVRRGGWGIEGLSLNHRIDLTKAQRRISNKPYVVVDGYLPGSRLAYEYDSTTYHAGAERDLRDRERASAAQCHDVTLLHITTDIVMDEDRFSAFCDEFSRLSGRAQRALSQIVLARRRVLREEVGLPLGRCAPHEETIVPLETYAQAGAL